tara:strand:- start:3107 stop:3751 length:645 start_codon:yes stop_codon:yes gene_type:complete
MSLLKKIYLSPLGLFISIIMNVLRFFTKPFMVYGYFSKNGLLKNTRISSTTSIINKNNLKVGDNCWIWHHSIIDASNGVEIGEGVQIGAFVGIFTHSSHVAIRLLGTDFINKDSSDRVGYVRAPVSIGDYSFIAASAVIMPGTNIGKGCVIGAGSIVKGDIPDYSIVAGNPCRIVGSIDSLDKHFINEVGVDLTYFDSEHFLKLRNEFSGDNRG